jgi:acyl dehydratase
MTTSAVERFANFDDVVVGHTSVMRHEITAAAVDAFAQVSGDVNPLHMSDGFAQVVGFSGRVAHGALQAAYLSCLLGTKFPGPGCFWVRQTFEWRMPVFVGDVIDLQATVKHKSAGTRTLLVNVEARNQKGQLVMNGEGMVRMLAKVAGANEVG